MTCAQHPTPADPASPEPAAARAEACTCCGGTREPDPTDFFIGMMKAAAQHCLELSSLVVVEARGAVEAAASADEAAKPAAASRNPWYSSAALAHARLARSLRFCMALAIKAHEDRRTREDRIARGLDAVVQARKARLKKKVKAAVEQAIERQLERERERLLESEDEEYDEQDEINKDYELRTALAERLDDEDIERDLDAMSRGEMATRVCDDLNVEPALDVWGSTHWARDEALNNVPGSPFAGRPDLVEPAAAAVTEVEPEPAKPPEPEVAEALPEEPAVPVRGSKEWYQSDEHKRECEEYQARVRARFCGPL